MKILTWRFKCAPWLPPVQEYSSQNTGPCWHWIIKLLIKLLHFKHFSLLFTLFGACGDVFIMKSERHLRKINLNEYFKAICIVLELIHPSGLNLWLMYRAVLKRVSRKLRPQTLDSENSDRENSGDCWCDPSVTLIGRERTNSSWVCLGVRWIIQSTDFREKQGFDGKNLDWNALQKNKHVLWLIKP